MRERLYYVYILASNSGTLYVGMTNNLLRRTRQHKSAMVEGFTKKYGVSRPIYFEGFRYAYNAIHREKQIKSWRRDKKVAPIESMNPTWKDLSREWFEKVGIPLSLRVPSDEAAGDPAMLARNDKAVG